MSEYIWHHTVDGDTRPQLVVVLAWHEGTATVVDINDAEAGGPVIGSHPYLVKYSRLKLGRPPAEAVAA